MQDNTVSNADREPCKAPGFTSFERIVLASGACVMSVWLGGLAWVGYKLVVFII